MAQSTKAYSIDSLVRATGISPHSLRNWERRYSLLKPSRTPTGRRIYSASDLETVRRIARLLKAGAKIGDLQRLLAEGEALPAAPVDVETDGPAYALFKSLCAFQSERAEFLASMLALSLAGEDLVNKVYEPLLHRSFEMVHKGQLSGGQGYFITTFIRQRLMALASVTLTQPSKLCFLLATLPGERQDSSMIILNCLLRLRGHKTLLLGCEVPIKELRSIDSSVRLDAIVLSFSSQRVTARTLSRLCSFKGRVVLGGSALRSGLQVRPPLGLFVLRATGEDAVVGLEEIASMPKAR